MNTNPRGGWVTISSLNLDIQSISWTGGNSNDGCGLYAIEIDGQILGDESGYINKGIKFYAPTASLDVSTSSLLLTDGEISRDTTTVEWTGAPDGYASYLEIACPLNEDYQFRTSTPLIDGIPYSSRPNTGL